MTKLNQTNKQKNQKPDTWTSNPFSVEMSLIYQGSWHCLKLLFVSLGSACVLLNWK